jgi:hypothetical protein
MPVKSSRNSHVSSLVRVLAAGATFFLLASVSVAQQGGQWLRVHVPTAAGASESFRNPPAEYGLVLWWFWNGDMTEADIQRDLEDMKAHGARSVLVFPYYGMSLEYLSPAYFERIRFAVQQAKRTGVRVWLMDEGSYPTGFVGGRITRERPDLGMRVLTAGERFTAREGQQVALRRDDRTVAVIATHTGTGERRFLSGQAPWVAPAGSWDVRTVRWEFRTSPTRHANRAGFFKDTMFSMFDPLDPEGTKFFLDAVHEQYRKHIGDEFGKTVMGFMGDEPSVAGLPWSPRFLEEFSKRKGYDLRPHLGFVFGDAGADGKVRADYFDVWTDLYNENFFRPQAEWCARYGMEYVVHLCGEEDTPTFIKLNGDYFKANRHVQIPGVDAIWRQIWYDKTEYYPKLASSSAHLRGQPRAATESFAVYGAGLSLAQAKWVFDYQAVRGINHFQAMEYLSSTAEHRLYFHPPHWPASPQWPYFSQFADYASRVCYLLSVGRPAAKIAVYFPTTSGWAEDWGPDKAVREIARRLSEAQRDFDLVDEDGLQSDLTLDGSGLRNRSGQVYRAVVIPPVRFLSAAALEKLDKFARAGGKVLFIGAPPQWIVSDSYRSSVPGESAVRTAAERIRTERELDAAVLARLPKPDVTLSPATRDVKYIRRSLDGAELYFFFNEGASKVKATAELEGSGIAELWDPRTGDRAPLSTERTEGAVRVPLWLEPYATAVVVVGAGRADNPGSPPVRFRKASTLDGDWELAVGGKSSRGSLRSWTEIGLSGYSGVGTYRKQFTVPDGTPVESLWLDLGEVRYAAQVRVNGKDLGRLAWGPFRWHLAGSLRAGVNTLEVDVANTRANELAGDPARFAEIESKGWLKNSYVNMYLKFDKEMKSSGLLGPVTLATAEAAR